ncbi:mediator-associated protein 1 [Dorcoceras hygrometricum]|uniref:Mediator-associated protein 1 n=1 Tax=Dorcoceras hygrometricum TaxID=472368 RepID=A0A2Z7D2M7_9LAMI|nr:mediator-associated protein 1 [Dorcoceras hygrometricum]
MAKSREPEKPVEYQTDSGEEEDEASSEEVGSSDSDSEPEQGKSQFLKKPVPAPAAPKKLQPQTVSNPQQPASSSDDEESGSESESEGPKPQVKPLASRPMDSPQKSAPAGKLRSKPNATVSSTPTKSAGAKRPAEEKEVEAKENKKSKKKPEPQPESSVKKSPLTGDDSKKQLFQRLWSEDDEIVILEGMAEYAEKKRSDPVADLSAFLDFIKKNLHVDVTRVQLQDKIRRLKRKYENNKNKEKEGKDKTFTKPHEQKAYELSKVLWGSDKGKETGVEKVLGSPKANGSPARKNLSKMVNVVEDGHSKEVKNLENENDELVIWGSKRLIAHSESVEERILRAGAEFFEGDKKLEGAREWKKLRQEEVEIQLKKLDVLRAQTKLVLDALKSSYQ